MNLVRFLPEAEAEFRTARAWYDSQRSGLGDEFRDAIDAAVERIRRDPESLPLASPSGVRYARANRFPYVVYFKRDDAEIVITSVFHFRRNPRVWRRRTR